MFIFRQASAFFSAFFRNFRNELAREIRLKVPENMQKAPKSSRFQGKMLELDVGLEPTTS